MEKSAEDLLALFKDITLMVYPDFATCSILTIEKNVENTAFGLYFFNFML